MLDKQTILSSEYVIDGARMDITPKRILENCMNPEAQPEEELSGRIVDEVPDISPVPYVWNPGKIEEYAQGQTPSGEKASLRRNFRKPRPGAQSQWPL